ncbi:MAG: hypothetical protein JWN99_2842 [Ilumatobacteraceae bacterium]|nr:hypothetical protein [Ilumatobacteraceae bacterium]
MGAATLPEMENDTVIEAEQDQLDPPDHGDQLDELLVEEISIDGMCGVY